MTAATVAVFCIPGAGHFQPLRPIISDLARHGFAVHVFTHRRFAPDVERSGGIFVDLFERFPLERADGESIPVPCRYVTFAAVYAEEVLEEMRRLRPALIVYETFSVVARLAALQLGIPFVNVSPAHNMAPGPFVETLRTDPRVAISERCHRAVDVLRERYGQRDASPFSYLTGLSPYLNICAEPPPFLTADERKVFEPIAFYGSLLSLEDRSEPAGDTGRSCFKGPGGGLRIYASFGTVAFTYYAAAAVDALEALADCVVTMPGAQALISLGGATIGDDKRRQFERPNVEVIDYVDQWSVLSETDVFLTHHGLNSTHEAIFKQVPMLSYPIFSDQPAMADKCRGLGIAVPITNVVRGRIGAGDVRAALETLSKSREVIGESLRRARTWELEVIASRPSVLERMADLASAARPGS